MKSKIKEIQEGNQASYEVLEKEFHPAIHRLINKWGFGYDRDEYFQIGRITFYECVMKFDDSRGAKLITYFMNTLNYKFGDLKKRIRNDVEFDEEQFYTSPDTSFDLLLEGLEPDEKGLIKDYFYYGLTHDEIASKIGMSRRWVGNKIDAILNKMRYNISEEGDLNDVSY